VGYVVGREGHTINNIEQRTNTKISNKKIDDNTYFVIEGTENQYVAKLIIKKTVVSMSNLYVKRF
jgi:rRNA processing protein Krr1/Pno1